MVSQGFKDLEPWAVTGDRTAPDDPSLTPPIDVAEGFPASFSQVSGDTPRRPVVNEILYRITAALVDVRNHGALPWDADVDTLQGGVKQVAGVLYRALVDNGPTYGNAISPTASGQTVWEVVSGTLSTPSAPDAPTAVVGNGELEWLWNCPLDGGSIITEFDFQWRTAGQASFSASIVVTTPRYLLTGLTNGTVISAQVRARNAQGDGPWSTVGTGTPEGTRPGGGNTLALRADPGDTEAELGWLQPDDGGLGITDYTVQWRSSSEMFATTRQQTATGTTATVPGLVNGTEYFFRVRANNSAGSGDWSNEASTTPEAPAPPPPPDTAPSAPTALTGTPRRPLVVDWTWELPNSNGGQRIEDYDFQWRYQGDAWSGNLFTVERSYYRVTVADTTRGVQARVRARNSVGAVTWSGTQTVAASALLGHPTQRHRFTASQTWQWPYDDLERASVLLVGSPRAVGDSAKDISLGSGSWTGGVSDGTTLWFVDNTSTIRTARAYVASTRVRDSAKDISLGAGTWGGGVSDGTTLWFVNDTADFARAYVASTRARDSAKDIGLGTGLWQGAVTAGDTLWFVDSALLTARAYVASTRVRDSAKDIGLGTGVWRGAISDGTTLWFVDESADFARAYVASTRVRDSAKDIGLGTGNWQGAVTAGDTLWFVNDTGDMAVAYTAPSAAQLVTGGATHTTDGDADGVVEVDLQGIADAQDFAFTIQGNAFASVYPQC